MKNYQDYLNRKRNECGAKFDASMLPAKFVPFYESGQRIIVKTPWGETMRGYVGITTGWRPAFLLLSRCNVYGSSTLLTDEYEIVGTVNKFM